MKKLDFRFGAFCSRLIIIVWLFVAGIASGQLAVQGGGDFFGGDANGITGGLRIIPLSNSNNAPVRCTPIIKNTRNPTKFLWVWFPPIESCYQLTLTDQKGNLIPKTALGKSLGRPITRPLMLKDGPNLRAGYKGRLLPQNRVEALPDFAFILQDYFKITMPGKYRLRFEMRVVLPVKGNPMVLHSTNFPMLTLPPVVAEVEVKTGRVK